MSATTTPAAGTAATAPRASIVFRLPGTIRERKAYKQLRSYTTAEPAEIIDAVATLEANPEDAYMVFATLMRLGVNPQTWRPVAKRMGYMRTDRTSVQGPGNRGGWDSAS